MIKKNISKKVNKLRHITFSTRLEEYDAPVYLDHEIIEIQDPKQIRPGLKETDTVFQLTTDHETPPLNPKNKLERSKRNSFTSLNELADNYYKTKR